MITSDENGIVEITEQEFEEKVIKNEKLTVVDFFATWCGPCKMLAPVLEETSKKYDNISFYKMNVDDCNSLVEKYNIMGVPTVMYFRNGKRVGVEVGYRTQNELEDIISKLA